MLYEVITVFLENFVEVVDVGVNQKQLVEAAPVVFCGLADQGKFLLEFFPEGIAFLRVVDVTPKHFHQLFGIAFAVDVLVGDVTVGRVV